jgi:hypothetical protein
MYKVWMEWDYGQDDIVFNTEESARQFIQETIDD